METIDNIVKEMRETADVLMARGHESASTCHRKYADRVCEAWNYAKSHPEEWCSCDKCIIKHEKSDWAKLLMMIVNFDLLLSDEETACDQSEFMTSSEFGVCDANGRELSWHSVAEALNVVAQVRRALGFSVAREAK